MLMSTANVYVTCLLCRWYAYDLKAFFLLFVKTVDVEQFFIDYANATVIFVWCQAKRIINVN